MRVAFSGDGRGEEAYTSMSEAFAKHIHKAPKSSLTESRVLSQEFWNGTYPVTRVEHKPLTGRTHQLRVHCAAIGQPIIEDDIYGLGGEGSFDGGLRTAQTSLFKNRAPLDLQQDILREVKLNLCLHSKQLCIYHPYSGAPMVFEAKTNFYYSNIFY
jgi:23S rRNA-/tRNA-specific pseudouridylate synthase